MTQRIVAVPLTENLQVFALPEDDTKENLECNSRQNILERLDSNGTFLFWIMIMILVFVLSMTIVILICTVYLPKYRK